MRSAIRRAYLWSNKLVLNLWIDICYHKRGKQQQQKNYLDDDLCLLKIPVCCSTSGPFTHIQVTML